LLNPDPHLSAWNGATWIGGSDADQALRADSPPRLSKQQVAIDETVGVDVDVTNTGRRMGDEVIQLYIRDDASSVSRPVLELKAFRRITLNAGEKRTVHFEIESDALAFWDIHMRWVVEPGTFTISAGDSSIALKSTSLTVGAVAAVEPRAQ
jgi:beta-glucosidase